MASKTIDWGDGTTDKIYLSYSEPRGTQNVTITSDENTGYVTRSKNITVSTSGEGSAITRTAIINQAGKNITIITRNDAAMTYNGVAIGYE